MQQDTTIQIDKNVPIPPVAFKGGRKKTVHRRTLESLDVGDSFLAPEKYLSQSYVHARDADIKIQVRREVVTEATEDGGSQNVLKYRIWRVS
jgi:hypothetical protein